MDFANRKREILQKLQWEMKQRIHPGMTNAQYLEGAVEVIFEVAAEILAEVSNAQDVPR